MMSLLFYKLMHCLNIVLKINVLSPPVLLSELMFLAFILLQRCWALLGTRTVLGACALHIDEMGTGGWSSLWSCGVAMSRRIPSLSFWLFHQFQLSSESYVYVFSAVTSSISCQSCFTSKRLNNRSAKLSVPL